MAEVVIDFFCQHIVIADEGCAFHQIIQGILNTIFILDPHFVVGMEPPDMAVINLQGV